MKQESFQVAWDHKSSLRVDGTYYIVTGLGIHYAASDGSIRTDYTIRSVGDPVIFGTISFLTSNKGEG